MKAVRPLAILLSLASVSAHAGEPGAALTIVFPHVYNLSYENLSREAHWSWGTGLGIVPPIRFNSGASKVGVSTANLDARGRWHPFAGTFFLGLALGFQNVKGTGDQNIDVSGQPVPTHVEVSVNNLYLTPHLGWIWTIGSLMLGLEMGNQLGFGGQSQLSLSISDPTLQSYLTQVQGTAAYQQFQSDIQNGFAKLGNAKIFYAAVRLGWMF